MHFLGLRHAASNFGRSLSPRRLHLPADNMFQQRFLDVGATQGRVIDKVITHLLLFISMPSKLSFIFTFISHEHLPRAALFSHGTGAGHYLSMARGSVMLCNICLRLSLPLRAPRAWRIF